MISCKFEKPQYLSDTCMYYVCNRYNIHITFGLILHMYVFDYILKGQLDCKVNQNQLDFNPKINIFTHSFVNRLLTSKYQILTFNFLAKSLANFDPKRKKKTPYRTDTNSNMRDKLISFYRC